MPLYASGDVRRLALILLLPAVAAGTLTACEKESVRIGFRPDSVSLALRAGQDTTLTLELVETGEELDLGKFLHSRKVPQVFAQHLFEAQPLPAVVGGLAVRVQRSLLQMPEGDDVDRIVRSRRS